MWNGGDIVDAADLVTTRVQRTHCRFTTRARALHINVEVFEAVFQSRLTSTLSSHLGSKGRAFTRTTETGTTGSRPAQSIALTVGDGDDGVVERRMDVGDPINHCLFYFFTNTSSRLSHICIFLRDYLRIGLRGPLRVRALVLVRWPRTGRPRR